MEEKDKKVKYLHTLIQQLHHYSHFVGSVEGILEWEAEATLKRIASLLAAKWQKPYLST